MNELKSSVMEDIYRTNKAQLAEQKQLADSLQRELDYYSGTGLIDQRMGDEMKVLFPTGKKVSISRSLQLNIDSSRVDTLTFAIVSCHPTPGRSEVEKLSEWLKARVSSDQLRLFLINK